MKKCILFVLIIFSIPAMALDLSCDYTNHDSSKGSVLIKINETQSSVTLEFDSASESATNCIVAISSKEITAECDQEQNAVGVILELVNNKLKGIIISENQNIFAETTCK